MIPGLVLPALAALALGVPAAGPHRRLHPSLGARGLAIATAALGLAVVAAAATLAVGFLSGIPWVSQHFSWCTPLSRTHDAVPVWLGVPAIAALSYNAAMAARAWREVRRAQLAPKDFSGDVRVVNDDRPDAYAMAGRPGHVVVSTGMLRLLDPTERQVLLAHERSHLRHRHHRYIALAVVATAAVPVLSFVTERLRLAAERWADEDAAAEIGDRELVARTIIRAALASADYERRPALGLGVVGVRARVDALLLPPPTPLRRPLAVLVAVPGATAGVIGGSAFQVHHLFAFASHVCGL